MSIVLVLLLALGAVVGAGWWVTVSERFTGWRRALLRLATLPVMVLAMGLALVFVTVASEVEDHREWQRCQANGRC